MERNTDWKIRAKLRRSRLAARDALPETEQETRSSRICANLFKLTQIRNASTVFVYMHFRSEVQTAEFINFCLCHGKNVTIPYTLPDEKQLLAIGITDLDLDLEPGYCGILEPAGRIVKRAECSPRNIDVVIVPGAVFDRTGGRLGYGGGFYDRFLALKACRAFRIGLAYEMQMIEKVPVEQHDQLMDLVVTEANIYDCRRNRHAQNSSLS
ncbi:MAG: 5-formyltetrahydrofolate cyclo-ligase [Desulfobulbaceae bacterium]|nr:5-formyltetrahydrofolate cyclo-ligase [Desulfobulbaceae bacterium]